MDIDYLLWLQELREKTAWLVPILSKYCDLNVVLLPALCLFLYLSVDKRAGLWALMSFHVSEIANLLVKNICCVYRPYIKDARLTPPAKSTSYSFPSGHTMYATSMYGTVGVWQWKRRKWITILCGALIFLTGFARNYLSVHTPQDVAVSFILTTGCVALCAWIIPHLEQKPEHQLPAVLIGAVIGIAVLVFLELKSYPLNYDADGKLLVDPFKTKTEVYECIGKWLGFLVAMVIDLKLTHFTVPENKLVRYVGGAAGATICTAGIIFLKKAPSLPFGAHWGGFLVSFVLWLFLMGIYPLILQKLNTVSNKE